MPAEDTPMPGPKLLLPIWVGNRTIDLNTAVYLSNLIISSSLTESTGMVGIIYYNFSTTRLINQTIFQSTMS